MGQGTSQWLWQWQRPREERVSAGGVKRTSNLPWLYGCFFCINLLIEL